MTAKLDLVHSVFEVLNSSTHKYSSTAVSSDNTNTIRSTVTHHSDQELWLKDLDSGKDRKFDFTSFNVDAQPGHKLLMIWDKKGGRLERIINPNTSITNAAYGIYNTWGPKNKHLQSRVARFTSALFTGAFSMVPVLGWLVSGLVHLFGILTGKAMTSEKVRSPITRLHNAFVTLCILLHLYFSLMIADIATNELAPFRYEIETLGYYFLYPVFELAQLLGSPLSWWWVMTLGLTSYITISTWLNHRHHFRRLSEASSRIDEYAREVTNQHPAFSGAT